MNRRTAISTGASLLVATMALSACGTRGGDSGSDNSSGGGKDGDKVVKIGVIAPLSGNLSALGKGIQNSVDLAIKEANESGELEGYTIEIAAEDDQANPDVGKNAASKLAGDKDVIGVVGTLNSSVAGTVAPVLNTAKIVQVSPANTGVSLTKGEDPANPKRPYANYFRTCTTDAVQGPFAARYLFNDAGVKKVATIHDKKAYGQGLVESFTEEFTKLGGEVVAAETINPDDDKYDAVITSVKAKKPDAVYYGGEYPEAGPLSQQMKAQGLEVPLMGGDGIIDPKYAELAGKTSDGDYATGIGGPAAKLGSAKSFVDAYEKAGYGDPYSSYGASAYDAARAIIAAAKVSLKDADSVEGARQATIDAMKDVSFDGATGKVAFDEFGDTTTRVLTAYEIRDGEFVDVKTEEFK